VLYPTDLLSGGGAQTFVRQLITVATTLALTLDSPIGRREALVNGVQR
jgi:hypothetical protein